MCKNAGFTLIKACWMHAYFKYANCVQFSKSLKENHGKMAQLMKV